MTITVKPLTHDPSRQSVLMSRVSGALQTTNDKKITSVDQKQ